MTINEIVFQFYIEYTFGHVKFSHIFFGSIDLFRIFTL